MLSMLPWSQYLSNKEGSGVWGGWKRRKHLVSSVLSAFSWFRLSAMPHSPREAGGFCPATCHDGKCVLWWTGRWSLPNTTLVTFSSSCWVASSLFKYIHHVTCTISSLLLEKVEPCSGSRQSWGCVPGLHNDAWTHSVAPEFGSKDLFH